MGTPEDIFDSLQITTAQELGHAFSSGEQSLFTTLSPRKRKNKKQLLAISGTSGQVLLIVDTNYGVKRVRSNKFYTHFSLLKSIEAGFQLPCLNHASDAPTAVMSDLFAAAPNPAAQE